VASAVKRLILPRKIAAGFVFDKSKNCAWIRRPVVLIAQPADAMLANAQKMACDNIGLTVMLSRVSAAS